MFNTLVSLTSSLWHDKWKVREERQGVKEQDDNNDDDDDDERDESLR